jgi:hypothetical protein
MHAPPSQARETCQLRFGKGKDDVGMNTLSVIILNLR